MKKLWKASLVVAMAATTLVGCGDKGSDAGAGTGECKVRIGFVTDIGGIDDKSFNQGSYEGIQKFAKDSGLADNCITYLQSENAAQYVPNLIQLAEEKYDLVVAAGYSFDNAMKEVSAKFPDTKFFVIDTVVAGDNVVSGVFAAEQSSYLAGMAAAMQAKADGGDTVGFVGGTESELIKVFQAGFEQGAKAVDSNIKIMIDYAGGFGDAAKGQTLADKQYNAGAKVIYHAAGGTGSGVIKIAKERAEKGEKVWAVGVDRDQYEDGKYGDKSAILTSALKRVDTATYDISKTVLDGTFKGGTTVNFDIKNEGVGIPAENPNLSDEIKKALDKAVEDIKAGTIEVSKEAKIANGQVG